VRWTRRDAADVIGKLPSIERCGGPFLVRREMDARDEDSSNDLARTPRLSQYATRID
jgi:hypothetical protein